MNRNTGAVTATASALLLSASPGIQFGGSAGYGQARIDHAELVARPRDGALYRFEAGLELGRWESAHRSSIARAGVRGGPRRTA